MQTDELSHLLHDVADEVILPRFRALEEDQIDEKKPGDFVTIADRDAEALITRSLLADDPDCLVVGEEASHADPSLLEKLAWADHAWVVDPVDGTRNFVHDSPDFAVMVAELRSGVTQRAWIYQPIHQVTYVAELGAGVTKNDVLLSTPEPGHPLRGTASRREWIGLENQPGIAKIRPTAWCCGVDYPRLLEGSVDFSVFLKVNPWDHLPGTLMLRELGGKSRIASGEDYRAGVLVPRLLLAINDATWRQAAALVFGR